MNETRCGRVVFDCRSLKRVLMRGRACFCLARRPPSSRPLSDLSSNCSGRTFEPQGTSIAWSNARMKPFITALQYNQWKRKPLRLPLSTASLTTLGSVLYPTLSLKLFQPSTIAVLLLNHSTTRRSVMPSFRKVRICAFVAVSRD